MCNFAGETDKARKSREKAEEAYLKRQRKEEEEADSSGEEEEEEVKSLSSFLTPLERWEDSLMTSTSLSQVCGVVWLTLSVHTL